MLRLSAVGWLLAVFYLGQFAEDLQAGVIERYLPGQVTPHAEEAA